MLRDGIACGFPGLPKWLDRPLVKRMAEEYGVTEEEAREYLRKETKPPMTNGEIHGECRTVPSLPINRKPLSKEPQDAPSTSSEDDR